MAPSNELRKWYEHDPAKWEEFKRRYFLELEESPEGWRELLDAARKNTITLLFSSKEIRLNNAFALKEFLEGKLSQ